MHNAKKVPLAGGRIAPYHASLDRLLVTAVNGNMVQSCDPPWVFQDSISSSGITNTNAKSLRGETGTEQRWEFSITAALRAAPPTDRAAAAAPGDDAALLFVRAGLI